MVGWWLVVGCGAPDADGDGVTVEQGDCDDADPRIHPGEDEWCDGVDEDCDGEVDDDARDLRTFYADADGDGYGDPDAAIEACEAEADFATTGSDCDDGDPKVNPEADDTDTKDRNCDGEVGWSAKGQWSGRCDEPTSGYFALAFDLDLDEDRQGNVTGTGEMTAYYAGSDVIYVTDFGTVEGTRTGYDLSITYVGYFGAMPLDGEVKETKLVLENGYGDACTLTR